MLRISISWKCLKVRPANQHRLAGYKDVSGRSAIDWNCLALSKCVYILVSDICVLAKVIVLRLIECDTRGIMRHDVAQRGRDGSDQVFEIEMTDYGVVNVEQEPQSISFADEIGVSRFHSRANGKGNVQDVPQIRGLSDRGIILGMLNEA
jgi:hypothetical protein